MDLARLRNIGISAHIDSGKTTLSERILFYTGRIHRMQEVHDSSDGGGATMDHMELERERGITITSAATQVEWSGATINLIDTPGHVDFTVEVERSLRVLDGAILVLCAVGGVQAQSLTIDRQMRRYHVPRLAFINKMDRVGADPEKVIEQLRAKLDCDAMLVQLPIGREADFRGVIDLVTQRAIYFDGPNGEEVRDEEIPAEMVAQARAARHRLLEALSMYSDELMEILLAEEEPPVELIHGVLRSAVAQLEFTPVLLGSAYRNKGVQPLLDAVVRLLPSPLDGTAKAFAKDREGQPARNHAGARPRKAHRGDGLQDGRRPLWHADVHAALPGPLRQGRIVFQPAYRAEGAIQPHRAACTPTSARTSTRPWPATSWPCWASIAPAATPTARNRNIARYKTCSCPSRSFAWPLPP